MQPHDELLEVLPLYLREKHKLSEDALWSLGAEWNQQGCILQFLVGRGLLTRSTASTLEAVH